MPEVEVFEAKLGELRRIRRFIQRVCQGDREDWVEQLQVIVDEAFTNIISHGKTHEAVFISLIVEQDQVVVELWDQGQSFDPSEIAISDLDKGREDGMGLMILRELVDKMAYFSKEGAQGWNRLQLFIGRPNGVAS